VCAQFDGYDIDVTIFQCMFPQVPTSVAGLFVPLVNQALLGYQVGVGWAAAAAGGGGSRNTRADRSDVRSDDVVPGRDGV
jgi:hypothetical protein